MRKLMIVAMLCLVLVGARPAWALFESEADNEQLAVTFAREAARGEYRVLTTQELKAWMDQKKPMLVVDTMPFEDSYKKQHVPGAVQFEFPIPEMKDMDPARQEKFRQFLGPDTKRIIVFYCGFTKCTRSHNAAMWARKMGYEQVYRCPGGIKAWRELGFPVGSVK